MFRKAMNLALVFLLSITSLVSVSPATASDCTPSGTGGSAEPFIVCDAASLQAIENFNNAYYVLDRDIDMKNIPWRSFDFEGQLDGAGHSIRNLNLDFAGDVYTGMFAFMSAGSVVKNLRFTDAHMSVFNTPYAGVLAGLSAGAIDSVVIEGSIETDSHYTGGVVGLLDGGRISNVVSNLDIYATNTYASGIAGNSGGNPEVRLPEITNSIFVGTIVGGIARPVSGEAMPFEELNDNHALPTCEYVTSSFYLAASSATGCGTSISKSVLQQAHENSDGFEGWDTEIWNFGDGFDYPSLVIFPNPPSAPRGITVFSLQGGLLVTISPGYSGGLPIAGYDLEYRRPGGAWEHEGIASAGSPRTAVIQGLDEDSEYFVRARARTNSSSGEWFVSQETFVPRQDAFLPTFSPAKSFSNDATGMFDSLVLPNGYTATPYLVQDDQNTQLRLAMIDDGGNLEMDYLIHTFAASSGLNLNDSEDTFKLLSDSSGRLSVFWITELTTDGIDRTDVWVSSSDDGSEWSTPVTALPSRYMQGQSDVCSQYYSFCGYNQLEAGIDQSGNLAVAAIAPATLGMDIVASSSTSGTTWAPAKVFNSLGSAYNLSLAGLKKGFMLGWGATSEAYIARYSILKTPGKSSWSAQKEAANENSYVSGQWHLRNSTTATYVWSSDGALKIRDYSLSKGKFLKAAVTVRSGVALIVGYKVAVASSSQLVLTWTASTNSPLTSNIETVRIPSSNAVPAVSTIAATDEDTGYWLIDMHYSNSGSQSILYEELTSAGSRLFYGIEHSGSVVTKREVPRLNEAHANAKLLALPSGKMNIISIGFSEESRDLEVVQVKSAKAPQIVTARTISGIAQVGKTLSLSSAKWLSVAKLSSSSTQWYRCTSLKVAGKSIPKGCSKISGATKSTYKATKSDKGKYLIAVSKATNQAATTYHSSASSSVVR